MFAPGKLLAAFIVLLLGVVSKDLIAEKKPEKQILSHTSRINPHVLLEVIENQLKVLREKEIDKAYRDFTASEFQKQTSLEDFREIVGQFTPLSNNKLFQFQSFYTEDDVASFGGDLLATGGDFVRVEYDLVMEGGKWKIFGIQIFKNTLGAGNN